MNSTNSLETHFNIVATAFRDGRVIPFFGAGANLCNRKGATWERAQEEHLPSAVELARYLAKEYAYPPAPAETPELTRVSQYIDIMHGLGTLYENLHDLLDRNYPPTELHRFFASLPNLLRGKYPIPKLPHRQRLVIMTTNYDDMMERAFQDAGINYHMLTYVADLKEREEAAGRFLHWPPGGDPVLLNSSSDDDPLYGDQYPVLIKIHGNIDRLTIRKSNEEPLEYDSYVITEDHYIDYLTSGNSLEILPASILSIIKNSSFLFLGYSLRDWNWRVILRRIWRERRLSFPSWAVLKQPTQFDENYWGRRGVVMVDMNLDKYVAELSRRI